MVSPSLYAQRRLLKDLQEVLQNPLPNVVGKPLEENLFIWHLNVRAADDNQLCGGVFHLILQFPQDYPNVGPKILLSSPLPHPNVILTGQPGSGWELSLWDCIPGFKGWSSAYSALSIFLQLQTFLLREDLQYDNRMVDLQQSISLANAFSCSECPHKGTNHFPAFPTESELDLLVKQKAKISVARPVVKQVLSYLKQSSGNHQNTTKAQVVSSTESKLPDESHNNEVDDGDNHIEVEKGWETVKSKNSKKRNPSINNTQQKNVVNHTQQKNDVKTTSTSQLLSLEEGTSVEDTLRSSTKSTHNTTQIPKATKDGEYSPEATTHIGKKDEEYRPEVTKSTKNAQKHRNRRIRKKATEVRVLYDDKQEQVSVSNDALHDKGTNMGGFNDVPNEALAVIITKLNIRDLSSLSMTCRGLKEVCENGYIWKEILHHHFPATSLEAATVNDWKHAYILESSNITSSLQCYHSKASFDEDVLGFPITYTINPRTKSVDYIQVSFDVLSQTAYQQQQVRTTANNEKFDLLLPLYINQEHFERGLPLLEKVARKLCPESPFHGRHSMGQMVLSFMPKLLNTVVVLLSDKGILASDSVADGFCMLHRLFIALCDHYNLWKEVEKRILTFVESNKSRHKDVCPNLGNFITLLSVCTSEETRWEKVVHPWISEQFDRSVIWMCKNQPHIVERIKVNPKCGGVDDELIRASWIGYKVGLRLGLFFSGFLRMIARPPNVPLHKVAAAYDALYGMASLSVKTRIREFAKRVMSVNSWPQYFQMIGLQTPSKEYMTGWLRQCWLNSLRKGYHTKNTDFSTIQRHGVSKILLRGETSHLGMKSTIQMHEVWRFTGERVDYLDASCLVYDFDNRFIAVADYRHMTSVPGIVHSGDEIDYEKREGVHTIHISLSSLARTNAKEMYFTMSGWAGVRLRDIRLPFVRVFEEESGTDLCEYHLEDRNLGDHRSVLMCRIYRNDRSPSASWYVQAIGQLGDGAADNYGPIHRMIEQRLQAGH